eukprot:m.71673 g.71673  ORF g.71673 m.71673 type:complete len:317 (+) comp14374_c0_seq3:59-1009(+)
MPSPSVIPNPKFNADAAAKELRDAMKGIGTDEGKIIKTLAHHSNAQRQEIAAKFALAYGKSLIDDLKNELGGKLEDVVLAVMATPADYAAQCLRKAMKGAGTDEEVLIEILISSSNKEIEAIKESYTKQFKRDLVADVKSETSGRFERILFSCLQGTRDESGKIDRAKAATDAHALFEAGTAHWGTDESEFNRVLLTNSRAQLKVICEEYSKINEEDLDRSIKKEMSGTAQKAFRAIVGTARDAPAYFAARLYEAMEGAGTNDFDLIRIVVTRSEIDMNDIKHAFYNMYAKTLEQFISGDCSGDYKKMLLALIGAQ